MVYEIPQQLQHKEKIIFGLTFSQLGWALLFGAIVLTIMTRRSSLTVNIIFASVPAILGVLFVFFDVSKWVKWIASFFRFRTATHMSLKMQRLINVKEIKDKSVYTGIMLIKKKTEKDTKEKKAKKPSKKKDEEKEKEKPKIPVGDAVAILQITPINFNIKNDADKESIIIGFQKFLNSLDFPIQFIVTTNTLNLDNYLDILQKMVVNKELFEEFSKFMKDTLLNHQMKTRFFYLVIPKRINLDIQCKICIDKLQSVGLKVKRLNDAEIVNKLFYFFNDAIIERNPVENIINPTHYLIAPDVIKDCLDYLKINDKFCRIVSAVGYPRMVESGFLDKIISSNDDFDISLHIEPFAIETMMIILNKELQKQRADLYAEELKKSINPSLEIKYHDTRKVLEDLQKGNEKLFNVSLYINCKGKTKEELDLLTKKVESELNAIMIIPQIPYFRQIQAYKSMIPIAKDELKIKRNIATKALSAFFPFTSPFLTVEPRGIMLGLNRNKVPYIRDIFSLSNANGLILATSGAGKSYFTKLLIARQLLNGAKIMVIDPQTEYVGLANQCNGEVINISKDSETIINPLDLMGHDFIEKRLALMDLFKIMFGELTEIQKSILDKAVTETYAKKGIRGDSYKNKKPPTLSNLYSVLKTMDKKASSMEKITYRALINRLYMYTDGVFNFLDKQSNINFEKDFVCFNIGEMPKQVKPVIMFLILDYVYMKMKSDKQRKLLVIDEAWSLLGHTEEASYIFEIVKTCRKFNMGLLLITQDVADLVNSNAGHAILSNSSYSFLLRQKPAIIDSVIKTFHLSDMEKEYLLTATQGKGILILDNEHQELEVIASPKEHEIITTNPDEILKQQNNQIDEKTNFDINLNTEQKIYLGKSLNQEEKHYLINQGYEIEYHVAIGTIKPEEYLIKKNEIESAGHTFLVENIKQELEKYTKDIQINLTKEADITFKDKKGKTIAIEVETGLSYNKNKKELINKFHEAELKYKNNLIIVLTTKKYKREYTKLFPDITITNRNEIIKLLRPLLQQKSIDAIPAKKKGWKKKKQA